MHDWNVVISVRDHGYTKARQVLQRYGAVYHTDYYNVLVMKVDDIQRLVQGLRRLVADDPTILTAVARVIPPVRCFDFQSHDDFEAKSREAALAWVQDLAHKSFASPPDHRSARIPRPDGDSSIPRDSAGGRDPFRESGRRRIGWKRTSLRRRSFRFSPSPASLALPP